MILSKLKACCIDCKQSYIATYSDLENRSDIIPNVKDTYLFCKHQNVCTAYQVDENPVILAPIGMLGVELSSQDINNITGETNE